jgi:CDP-glucose 4,6-dehydratase
MQNVFITGAAGLVGGHLVAEVLAKHPDARIVILARSRHPDRYFFREGLDKRCTLYFGDVRDEQAIRDIIYNEEIDTIFHLAAQPVVTIAYQNPRETWTTNFQGTLNILEAARGNKNIQAIVVASSDKAYGSPLFQPYTEEHPLHGLHPYDASKGFQDQMARTYAACYGVPAVVTRFGNIYGPGDLHFNRLIPGLMKAVHRGETFQVRSDGTMTRDLVYVKDVARIYLFLAEHIREVAGEAFNVSSGVNMTVREVTERVANALGKNIPCSFLGTATHEIQDQNLSDEKFLKRFGQAERVPFDEAVRETWAWYKRLFDDKTV